MAEENEDSQELPEAPKRSKLPMILALVGGLVVGGGGAAGYFLILAPEPEVAAKEDDAAKEEVNLAELKPHFVLVDRVSAPMIADGQHVIGHVSMYVRLQVKAADDQDWVRDRLPMVRHAINIGLAKVGVNPPETPNRIDYEGTATRITEAINDYLQTDKVLGALITEAVRL